MPTPKTGPETSPTATRTRPPPAPGRILTGDVIADPLEAPRRERPRAPSDYPALLWRASPEFHRLLAESRDLEEARERVYGWLERLERAVFDRDNASHILEKAAVRDAVRVFKSIIGPINEVRCEFSALARLWRLARGGEDPELAPGFFHEFVHLLRAVGGKSAIYREEGELHKAIPDFLRLTGRAAAEERSETLEELGQRVRRHFRRFPSGLEPEVVEWRRQNRQRILRALGGKREDWRNYRWHLRHLVRTAAEVARLIELPAERVAAIERAREHRLPFGITPYYLSLMDRDAGGAFDHAIRAQVLPPPGYVEEMILHRAGDSAALDFMGEHDTSPVDLVTRRYPLILILKPYNTCAQICVYCQRNWELEEVLAGGAMASRKDLDRALKWIGEQAAIGDVLITGGDPAVMGDRMLDRILRGIAAIDHVWRIRIGTRLPVVLPFRFTRRLCDILGRYHEPGRREVAVVTHVEHSYEITPELRDVVARIRRRGISVYNQQVFTVENSRRFETAKLRRDLRLVGIDPYYTFNMKGKRETRDYMVPIARLLQERKEEARLLPGLDRTDEPVFNVPRLGKNHLRAFQDRRLVMILADGSRVYEFHPWEKNIRPMPPYNYVDVPIWDYLEQLAARGEDPSAYRTIWYYY